MVVVDAWNLRLWRLRQENCLKFKASVRDPACQRAKGELTVAWSFPKKTHTTNPKGTGWPARAAGQMSLPLSQLPTLGLAEETLEWEAD